MADTATNRAYAWGLQTNYATQKVIAAAALKQLIVTDSNFINYQPTTRDNAEWSHGFNASTEQWLESHAASVGHTMPGFAQEIGRILYLNMSNYSVATAAGGTTAKDHTFKPTDPNTTRQDPAVTYAEKLGAGWDVLMPSAVSDGFTLRGSGSGVLTADFNLIGSGKIVKPSGVTWSGGTPSVSPLAGLAKLFNTQIALVIGGTTYGCRYRSFEINYRKTMLDEASYSPGCANFLVPGDTTSGMIRSSHEFDRQSCDFRFGVDMSATSPEFGLLQAQTPLAVTLTITGGIIEGAINHKLVITIPVGYYRTVNPVVANGIASFDLAGAAMFDVATSRMLQAVLTTNVVSYATGW